ncbi:MAG: hypothetical protein Roseis2KO_13810 [Roseivirga sp.]
MMYLIVALIMAVVSYFTRKTGNNNIYLIYFHAPIAFLLSALIFMPEKESHKLRIGVFASMVIVVAITIYEAFFLDGGVEMYNSLSGLAATLVIGFLSIRYLIKLRFNSMVFDLAKQPMFWIAIAFALMNIANIITEAFYKTLQNVDLDALLKLGLTSMAVNYIATIVYCIGLLKVKKNDSRKIPKLAT